MLLNKFFTKFLRCRDFIYREYLEIFFGVKIGNNTRIGSHGQILRGAIIGENTIIAANSTILPSLYPDNILLASTSGKIKKKIIDDK